MNLEEALAEIARLIAALAKERRENENYVTETTMLLRQIQGDVATMRRRGNP
jgi:hypothetical protein